MNELYRQIYRGSLLRTAGATEIYAHWFLNNLLINTSLKNLFLNRRTVQGPALPRSMTIGWGGVVSEKRMFCGFISRWAYLGKNEGEEEGEKEREKDRKTHL